ncbi:IS66 family insertion sequence element accessory protein TnpB, partial [Escherichia coli]|uniref:IS66 family insertion sequence element accessory protein TnpB n=1 Tax=Escherichia coli TaxID=562 RepID=UPI0020918395
MMNGATSLMRRTRIMCMRNGFNGLASKVQNVLKDDPFSGHLFIFRGRRGDQI